MRTKKLFNADFEIHASVKMLFPYLHTASGLSEWYADNVTINNEDKSYSFFWDGDEHRAKEVSFRSNSFVRFEFFPDETSKDDPSYFELRLESNELTQSVFLKVTDYSEFEDAQELQDIWGGLIDNLKKIVGG